MKTESQQVGQYELRQCVRRSAGVEAWRAYDTVAQRIVMLKFYRADLLTSAEALTVYLQNVEKVATLHHPHIAHIHDVQVLAPRITGEPSSLICLACEYIEGDTFADYLKSATLVGKLPIASEVIQLFAALAMAIDSAHQRGIVHGNLKPTNILLRQGGEVQSRPGTPLLTDFALSKVLSGKQGNEIPFYTAPEQLKGLPANERSDVYALGVILYELYTGVLPFRGNRPIAVMMQHMSATPTPADLVNPGVSPGVTRVIQHSLAKDPRARFPTATALVVALAEALHVAIPESLRRFAAVVGKTQDSVEVASQVDDPQREPASAQRRAETLPVAPVLVRRRPRRRTLVLATLCGLLLLLGGGLGTFLLVQRNAASASQDMGHAFFLNSGQLNESNTQGINDQLQIDLANLPAPAAHKSYYAWLLSDLNQSESLPLALGRMTVQQGQIHFLYPGDSQHTNLLAQTSRFLVTEEDTQNPSSNPMLDQSTWRYYAVLPQKPAAADAMHFSLLDHLRHLLVESPELAARGLHGGLAFWFARDTAIVADLTNSLAEDWQRKDTSAIHSQIVRILDYLDGAPFIGADVPARTPFLADPHIAQISLLGPAPQSQDPPGYVYQDEAPPGYIYLVQAHLNGAILSPQTTASQHELARQINSGIDGVRTSLLQAYQDARRLVGLNGTQLQQASALTVLDDLATQMQNAYTGQTNPATGSSQGGALWLYDNLQRLATFDVTSYTA